MSEHTINEIQEELIADFEFLPDWTDKYAYIIEEGKQLPELAEEYKTEENRVKGCQSRVWLHTALEDGRVIFEADSDAMITKGLVSMLVRVLSGHSPDEILNADLYFVDKVGMKEHLSPTRANGLSAMIKKMKMYALGYKAKVEGNS